MSFDPQAPRPTDPGEVGYVDPERGCAKPGCQMNEAAHRRKAEYLRRTIGPRAELDFEFEHPELEEDA